MCEIKEGMWKRKPTESLQCRQYKITYVYEGIPEQEGRSSSQTVISGKQEYQASVREVTEDA